MAGIVSSAKQALNTSREDEIQVFPNQPILKSHIEGKFAHLEQRFLRSMLENSNHCMRPSAEKFPGSEAAYRPEKLNISTISLSLKFDSDAYSGSHYEFVDNDPYTHLTYSDNISINDFEGLVSGSITKVLNDWEGDETFRTATTNLIVLNEFGFPFFRQNRRRAEFAQSISDLANKRNVHILCGSSHCFRRKQNIAMYASPRGEDMVEHAKYSPALSLGESLAPRTNLEWKYYKTELGQIGVLVCFDAIDPNVLLRQIYFHRDVPPDNRIHLYLIPSFSPNDVVRQQAEMLSYFTNSIVVYVNYQYVENGLNTSGGRQVWDDAHGVFISGEDITGERINLAENFGGFVNKSSSDEYHHAGGDDSIWASIKNYQLSYKSVLEEQKAVPNKLSSIITEIFSLAKRDPSFSNPDPQ